jgi:DNA repair protein RecN (Recombination protein N)
VIRDLSITNLGVIASATLEFDPGLTVLTGETGAGKTLVTTALSLLLGAKSDALLVRHGATEAVIDCTVIVSRDTELQARLDEIGAVLDADELIVTRTVGARSRALVGSRPVAAAVLADLLGDRVTVHGQHGQVRLTRGADQRALLDMSTPEIGALLPVLHQAWSNMKAATVAYSAATNATAQDEQVLAGYRTLVDDVSEIAPRLGEDALLDDRIHTLSALDAIERATRTTAAMLIDGDSLDLTDVTTLLAQARRLLEPHAESAAFSDWISRLTETQESLSAIAHEIGRYIEDLEADGSNLDEVLTRRSQIGSLMRRWNSDLDTLIDRAESAARALALAADPQAQLSELLRLLEHCQQEFGEACAQVHDLRSGAALQLSSRVQAELRELGLPHAEFVIRVEHAGTATLHGDDNVEFLFSANPGQPVQPLAAVGSGGELSRVMLALETVAVASESRVFVFDEVDAGVGGRAALEIGRRLAILAQTNQVIVVTHLAQVAAFADRHIAIQKEVNAGVTLTTAKALSSGERPVELARLLSGVEDSASAMAHAKELLDLASSARRG